MRRLHLSVLTGGLLAASMLLAAQAGATEEFPSTIRNHLGLNYTPPCSVCHEHGMVGTGTVATPFGMSLRLRGLRAEDDDSLKSALDELQLRNVDSDFDGVSDIDELKAHRDPNRYGDAPLDASLEPGYGCGATISRSTPSSHRAGSALVFGLAIAGLALRRRATTSRR